MISTKTRVMLWGRAAGRCSMPECRLPLVLDETETDDPSLVGEVCHIVSASEDGPRGRSTLSSIERDKYNNLILLCNVHHKLIDDQINHFNVAKLGEIKGLHEQFIALSFDSNSKRAMTDKELIAGYIDHWAEVCEIDDWLAWTSWLLSTDPSIGKDRYKSLEELSVWILSRVWPIDGFKEIRAALNNFRRVNNALLIIIRKHSETRSDEVNNETYATKRFYQIEEWDEIRYAELLQRYETHTALISDYVAELTRAANYICAAVRRELLLSFRLKEGLFLISYGPDMNFRWTTRRLEYESSDLPTMFESEENFNLKRLTRDFHFGSKDEADSLDAEYKILRQMLD